MLATKASWLRPAHATAQPALARAADGNTLRSLLRGHSAPVLSANFSPDGKRIVTASRDKTARVWDADNGKPVGEPMTHGSAVQSASFSPDGKRVVTASEDKTARVWDVAVLPDLVRRVDRTTGGRLPPRRQCVRGARRLTRAVIEFRMSAAFRSGTAHTGRRQWLLPERHAIVWSPANLGRRRCDAHDVGADPAVSERQLRGEFCTMIG
ncbi:MAG: hypothetical protein ABI831_28385 [Betaproteobacteria bacterium]